MSKNVNIHFKCQGRMYSVNLKTSVEEITLSMIEARIYKKLALDESKVKLQLSYYPLLVGCEELIYICDDEDVFVYITSIDKENRRCILFVEIISRSELGEQLSRTGKSSIGNNYDELLSNEIGANAITLYVENQNEAIGDDGNNKEDGIVSCAEGLDNSVDNSVDIGDDYVELPPIVESSQFIDAWEDGLGVSVGQEFLSKKALQDVVDRGSFEKSFGFVIKQSDRVRLVLKCSKENCKWRLRGARIPNTDIFSIRTYTKMHTCSRATESRSEANIKRHGTPQLVAAILQEDYPIGIET